MSSKLLTTLQRIENKLDRLLKFELTFAKEMLIMSDQINAALAKLASDFDAETNAVAAKLDALAAALATSVASQTPVNPAVMAQLQAVSDRLKALGSDPAQPIPPASV